MATYDPNNPEIIGLAEQKALAKALLQQGLNQNLQGQLFQRKKEYIIN
jgi:hypothetical protein